MRFFVIDSPVMRFLARIGDLIVLNLIFVISCIPVITAGTALSALYGVAMRLVRGEEPSVVREYIKAYKMNFKEATAAFAVLAAAGALLLADFRLIGMFKGSMYLLLRFILGAALGIWLLAFQYVFAYIGRFQNGVLKSLKNALFLSVAHFPSTMILLGISIGLFVITLFTSRTFVIGTILWTFFGFALLAYVQSFLFCRIFGKYEKIKRHI